MRFATTFTIGMLLFGGAASTAHAQDFHWQGLIPAGESVEIKGINGSIRAVAANTNEVDVTATKSARHSNPAEVRVEVVRHATGVTICAVYPDVAGREPNRCEPGSGGHSESRDNDTSVDFVVRVPPGVSFVARAVNGDVDGESLQGDVDAHSVNGAVHVSTTGRALASTVNGSITATMGRSDWPNGANFKTVNGSITLNVGDNVNAQLRANTVNGTISSDFPITVTGEFNRRTLRGTIGSGGPDLTLSTVNGSIKLLKHQ